MCAAAVTTRLLTATALLAIATAAAQERDGFSRLRRTSLTALYRLDRGGEKVETPRYMLELYERYNRAGGRGDRPENTVRSIHAGMGEVNGTAMFIFNLSSIRSTEKMLSAEIHLYKRKSHLLVPKGHVEMSLYELGVDYVNEKGKITLQEASYGWQWRDVTGAVLSCLATSRRRPPRAFGMNFMAERANGKVRPVALKRFSIHHSRPFLIIYSNETESAKLNQLDKVAERLKRFLPGDSDNGGGRPTGVNRTTTGVGADGHATGPAIGGWGNRLRRSILDNEIPQGPADYTPPKRFNFLRTHPNILQTREQGKQKKGSRLIPYPEKSHKRKRRKRRKRKRSRRKMANRHRRQRLPRKWRDHKENESTTSDVSNQSCRKRKLVVNFDDIGWGAWIISPRSFNAHFCAGSCPFPLTKNLRPSNHATIQSIVHAIGLYAGVPAPSCVPNSMSSITLLYFDEDRNVVLKNYPRMTVQSCSCR